VRVWKITEVNYGAGSFGFVLEDYPDWFGADGLSLAHWHEGVRFFGLE
jgi:hypothetical protein